jgi:hypothetical protein
VGELGSERGVDANGLGVGDEEGQDQRLCSSVGPGIPGELMGPCVVGQELRREQEEAGDQVCKALSPEVGLGIPRVRGVYHGSQEEEVTCVVIEGPCGLKTLIC